MNYNSKVFCKETKSYLIQDDYKKFKITGQTEKMGNISCAVLKREGDNKTYLKPWDMIKRLNQPGQLNIGAKLNNEKVRAIVKAAYTKGCDEVTFKELAEEHGVTTKTISSIVHGHAWRHITRPLIVQLIRGNKEVVDSCISASNKLQRKTNKLNGSIAKFMVRDHLINKVPIKSLAAKYCISESSARRVVTGKAWREYTLPMIADCFKWTNNI